MNDLLTMFTVRHCPMKCLGKGIKQPRTALRSKSQYGGKIIMLAPFKTMPLPESRLDGEKFERVGNVRFG